MAAPLRYVPRAGHVTQQELTAAVESATLHIPGPGERDAPRLVGDHAEYSIVLTGQGVRTVVLARYRELRAAALAVQPHMPPGMWIPGKKVFARKMDKQLLWQRSAGFGAYFGAALRAPGVLCSPDFAALERILGVDKYVKAHVPAARAREGARRAALELSRQYLRKLVVFSERRRTLRDNLRKMARRSERCTLATYFRKMVLLEARRRAYITALRRDDALAQKAHVAAMRRASSWQERQHNKLKADFMRRVRTGRGTERAGEQCGIKIPWAVAGHPGQTRQSVTGQVEAARSTSRSEATAGCAAAAAEPALESGPSSSGSCGGSPRRTVRGRQLLGRRGTAPSTPRVSAAYC
eukprot:TRINITY_DN35052_c0_g1_i1.p1 TRINITY_DN35052_c0_g1~~TRINITY_DN35052_c0_g1_i1.p1  ORF type:complete len:385 (+),score=95.75 TRINITY_DN35052_c0_g1_i1:98-1156(+)